ncbi:MAG: DNA primase [Candidatus Portnoybacteria bacterium CG10_big_fil_rev_8_21_14_0_10_36_7]|uniref:DNA primase n=1 Tax=Candidatus Portnoybacteria bacterium CG10_big_fil_rev_8_21_14_0_10_36_7 TaxID=1974812 RepID=A0A2M8KEE1_9BACT|nr:MAG: DNA primase [Candidatus Portnoybacteria bacterium CG10_big_fil_rev_8_21_14_0_10_36_7]
MAGKFLSSPSEEIKNRLDIIEVIGGYIKLAKAGRNYRANCPFHSEKTPSFMVSPDRQIFHCFGCGEGGDIFKFVMKMEGLEFVDALKLLAQRAGVKLQKTDPKLRSERQKLLEISADASSFFQKKLKSSMGEKIEEYLKKRGVKKKTIEDWQLGFAPDSFEALTDYLAEKNYLLADIEKTGLIVHKDGTNNYFDRFRNRIMFPITDHNGQVVGFSGRIFGEDKDTAKYINSPQTLIYDKSRILFGLGKAKVAIRQAGYCVVVEGNMDTLMSQQAGIKNCVASSGTAMTQYQLKILKRYTENLVLAFDMDIAGETATRRGIDSALNEGFNIKIVRISEKDPADLIKDDPKLWIEALKDTKNIIQYYFESVFAKYNPEIVEQKREIGKILLPVVSQINNKVLQGHWIGELAKRLKISENALNEALKQFASLKKANTQHADDSIRLLSTVSRFGKLEERLIGLLTMVSEGKEHLNEFTKSSFASEENGKLFEHIKKYCKKVKKEIDLAKLHKDIPEEQIAKYNEIIFQIEENPPDDLKIELELCVAEMKKQEKKKELEALGQQIEEAETKKNKKELKKLLEQFNIVSSKING